MEFYTHTPLGQEMTAVGGHYVLQAEKRVPFRGREMLVVIGYMVVDSSCCGTGGCGFARVPGYVVDGEARTSERGERVTAVDPVCSQEEREVIRKWLMEKEGVFQVDFG